MLRLTSVIIISFILSGSFIYSPKSNFPQKLSEWGIFEGSMHLLQPKEGVIPYELNTPLFSDYAEKSRLIRLPKGSSVNYKTEGVLDFPEGSLLVKTFYYSADFRHPGFNKRIIETRLLAKEKSEWKALTYVWNDEQTDAELEIAGDDTQVKYTDKDGAAQEFKYVIPNQNQCKGCHNINDRLMPIGPSVSQLNKTYQYKEGIKNQLVYWKEKGLMNNLPEVKSIPKTAVWNDETTGDINARARAYLAINCSHCHRIEGAAQTSGLFLTEQEKNVTAIGINKTPVAAGKGSGGRLVDIKQGDASASIMWYRMQTTNAGERMPELGRSLVHKEGLALITQWINQMKSNE